MSYTVGQRLGCLTVTQTTRHGVAEQVRCNCGATLTVRLEFSFHTPPNEIGAYHAPWLLQAEAGRLRYDLTTYPIHGLPNNAVDAVWRGLLVDAPGGPVLSELGAHMLAHYRQRRPAARPQPPGRTPPELAAASAGRRADPTPVQEPLFTPIFTIGADS